MAIGLMNRRDFLIFGSALALAACSQSQLVDNRTAPSLQVREVIVTTSVSRKETALPKSQIVEATRSRVFSTLRQANPSGNRPIRVEVNIKQFYIANAGAGVLLGSSSSSINTEIKLVDVATNTQIGQTLNVFGATEPRPTIFGAAAIKSPQQELAIITNDLAKRVKIAIYGE